MAPGTVTCNALHMKTLRVYKNTLGPKISSGYSIPFI